MSKWSTDRRFRFKASVFIAFAFCFWLIFPSKLFDDPYSTIIEDEHGEMLAARIADDGQWRFPEVDSLPENLQKAILQFEDEYFNYHPGVNPVSIFRAAVQNIKAGRVVSGGSTITMQVIRLSRKNQPRTFFEKLIEVYLALRLEFSFSKSEILRTYASHAPYGGNVVGVEAASWRYFNRPLDQLSWAEVSLLAVLPNAPALIHLGRNRTELKAKRDRLLRKLLDNEVIDSTNYSLSVMEPIPSEPKALPSDAFHLLDYAVREGKSGRRVKTTVSKQLQRQVSNWLDRYVKQLSQNQIHNACAIVVSLRTGEVKAYVGNATIDEARSRFVDLIHANRSSGSILKPFLYARAIEKGMIHNSTLLRDVPVTIGRFAPENFDRKFQGVVPAGKALSLSLNVPATLLLKDFGLPLFYQDLKDLGISTLNRPAGGYGLTLILGGAETNLWNLAEVYVRQSMQLKHPDQSPSYEHLKVFQGTEASANGNIIDPAAWWMVSEALSDGNRPGLSKDWRRFSSSRKIAWKTGTSHGFRDAWCIGYDAEHLVAVWVGNADGEGRPGLTGTSTAAPLMFEIFNLMPEKAWFEKPESSLKLVELCEVSGMSPSQFCPKRTSELPMNAGQPEICPYHELIFLNEQGERVYQSCATSKLKDTVWFQLDPVAGYYYQMNELNYRPVPAFAASCLQNSPNESIAIIYPARNAEIIAPRDFSGNIEAIQFQAAHSERDATLFWHLDDEYLGQTSGRHELSAVVPPGEHVLKIIDEKGNAVMSLFTLFNG